MLRVAGRLAGGARRSGGHEGAEDVGAGPSEDLGCAEPGDLCCAAVPER